MAGSKTRFGFAGGSEPPDEEESRAARTVYGRDVHLQVPPGFVPPQPPTPIAALPPTPIAAPPTPLARVASPADPVAETAERPLRPRPSRLARLLGQWSPSGRFESRSRMGHRSSGMGGEDVGELEVPRDTATRNVVVVLLVAAVAFGVTFAVVKLRQQGAAAPASLPTAVPAAVTTPAPAPTSPAAPTAPATVAQPAVAAPTAAPPRRGAASEHKAAGTAIARQSPKGLAPSPSGARRAHGPEPHMAEPPQHLKGELLPLQP